MNDELIAKVMAMTHEEYFDFAATILMKRTRRDKLNFCNVCKYASNKSDQFYDHGCIECKEQPK